MKQCTKCKNLLSLDNFPPDKRAKNGKQAQCRKCIKDFVAGHYRKYPAKHMLARAKARAIKKGFKFNLTIEDIIPLPTHCPIFKIPLRVSEVPQDENAYSLDRINNNLGYVKGNVIVMSYLANRLKNNGTAEQHDRIAAWMRAQGLK